MSRRHRYLLPLILIALFFLLIESALMVRALNRVTGDLARVQALVGDNPAGVIDPGQTETLDGLLAQITSDWQDLRASTAGWVQLGPLVGWVPHYGGTLAQAPVLLDFGDALIASAQDTLMIARSFNPASGANQNPGVSPGASILLVAQSQSAEIQQARQHLSDLARTRSQINAATLLPSLNRAIDQFDRLFPLWRGGLDGLALAPTLLGSDRPQTYLLLAQNNEELRPTGGFITGVMLVRIDHGEITLGEFQDSYAVDNPNRLHPTPPEALRQYMFAGNWVLRDSNWSPDFPTAARVAENIYAIDRGIAVDGVIAVNPQMIIRLLDALGPVTVPVYNERIDSTNAMAKMQEFWAAPLGLGLSDDRWVHRKDFIGKMLDAIFQRLRSGDFDKARIARVAYDAILAKDMLIYLNGVENQASFPWSGALYQGADDALMIVDSNVGWNKVDANVARQADYAVTWSESGQPHATLTITYTNLSAPVDAPCVHVPSYPPTYGEMQQGCYWDYLRVVVPTGSRLEQPLGDFTVVGEADQEPRTKFATLLVVPRGESRTVHLDYALPASNDLVHYALRFEKQPGAPTIPIRVRITPPPGWSVSSTSDSPETSDGTLNYSLILDRDQVIQVKFENRFNGLIMAALLTLFALLAGAVTYSRIARAGRNSTHAVASR